jgi:hypothetical protein
MGALLGPPNPTAAEVEIWGKTAGADDFGKAWLDLPKKRTQLLSAHERTTATATGGKGFDLRLSQILRPHRRLSVGPQMLAD